MMDLEKDSDVKSFFEMSPNSYMRFQRKKDKDSNKEEIMGIAGSEYSIDLRVNNRGVSLTKNNKKSEESKKSNYDSRHDIRGKEGLSTSGYKIPLKGNVMSRGMLMDLQEMLKKPDIKIIRSSANSIFNRIELPIRSKTPTALVPLRKSKVRESVRVPKSDILKKRKEFKMESGRDSSLKDSKLSSFREKMYIEPFYNENRPFKVKSRRNSSRKKPRKHKRENSLSLFSCSVFDVCGPTSEIKTPEPSMKTEYGNEIFRRRDSSKNQAIEDYNTNKRFSNGQRIGELFYRDLVKNPQTGKNTQNFFLLKKKSNGLKENYTHIFPKDYNNNTLRLRKMDSRGRERKVLFKRSRVRSKEKTNRFVLQRNQRALLTNCGFKRVSYIKEQAKHDTSYNNHLLFDENNQSNNRIYKKKKNKFSLKGNLPKNFIIKNFDGVRNLRRHKLCKSVVVDRRRFTKGFSKKREDKRDKRRFYRSLCNVLKKNVRHCKLREIEGVDR